MAGNEKTSGTLMKPGKEALHLIRELLEAGNVVPAIDRRHAPSELPGAPRYLELGHIEGTFVITA